MYWFSYVHCVSNFVMFYTRFRINSEGQWQGIVCEQGLGDHAWVCNAVWVSYTRFLFDHEQSREKLLNLQDVRFGCGLLYQGLGGARRGVCRKQTNAKCSAILSKDATHSNDMFLIACQSPQRNQKYNLQTCGIWKWVRTLTVPQFTHRLLVFYQLSLFHYIWRVVRGESCIYGSLGHLTDKLKCLCLTVKHLWRHDPPNNKETWTSKRIRNWHFKVQADRTELDETGCMQKPVYAWPAQYKRLWLIWTMQRKQFGSSLVFV